MGKIRDMTLSEWINQKHGTVRDLADETGAHYATVWKWVHGKKLPGWDYVAAIERATGGKVTAADFVPRQHEQAVTSHADAAEIGGPRAQGAA